MRDPADMRFTEAHEWVYVKGTTILVGLTEFAQQRLSDITHVEMPEPDDQHYEAREEVGVLESLQSSKDLHAPVSGRIVAINNELLAKPELVNMDPYGQGWLFEMKPDRMSDVEALMDLDEYEAGLPEDEDEEE